MIEAFAIVGISSLLIACAVVILFRREPAMRVLLPGDPIQQAGGKSLLGHAIPPDATHIAWIMHGEGEAGRVHTLYLQTLDNLRSEIVEAQSPWGPIIATSIELETDIRSRGCVPVTEVMYVIARVDRDGNERWLSRSREWVNRWDTAAQIYEVFPGQVR
jgi:hypothetical protein